MPSPTHPTSTQVAGEELVNEPQMLIGTAVGLLDRMLACAEAGDWAQVASLERDRQPLMEALESKYPPGTLAETSRAGLARLLAAHKRLMELGETVHGNLRTSLRQINKGRKAQQLYEGE